MTTIRGLRGRADLAITLVVQAQRQASSDYARAEASLRQAEALVSYLDNRRMETNSVSAHREWERAYHAVESADLALWAQS